MLVHQYRCSTFSIYKNSWYYILVEVGILNFDNDRIDFARDVVLEQILWHIYLTKREKSILFDIKKIHVFNS